MTAPDLATIVEGAVSMMLGLDPGELVVDAARTTGCSVCASVGFTGDWEGAVVVGCGEVFGREAAAAMFGTDPDQVDDEEVADALGELANMIGGNVKPLLPGAATLSLPTVVRGEALHLEIPGASVWVGVVYRRGDAEFAVQIFERAR